jgi:hypothetical protein
VSAVDNLERANEFNLLWPPLAEALDTYLKRKDGEAEGFERTWRLIHIWEAIALSLGAAAATRVREADGDAATFLRCRELYHGRKWDPLTSEFKAYSGALDGSASVRIDVLWEFGSREIALPFLEALRAFLTAEIVDLSSLVREWIRVCDAPPDARRQGPHQVREALRHVNTLRNRFAHVPFPYDCMDGIADALEDVTGQVFGSDPAPWRTLTKDEKIESPLTGGIIYQGRLLRGNAWRREGPPTDHQVAFVFPPVAKQARASEVWDASPFIFVDSMGRPHILTRALSKTSGAIELTRFQAEANSVRVLEDARWDAAFPAPAREEYAVEEADESEAAGRTVEVPPPSTGGEAGAQQRRIGHDEALRLVRNEQFEPAIAYFAEVARAEPLYHIAWLRLGHAQRELAMRLRSSERDRALSLFSDSIASLEKATAHDAPPRRAQAFYELSKSRYQRWRFSAMASRGDYDAAYQDASRAFEISPDTSFETWLSYLRDHGPGTTPPAPAS